MNHTFSNSQLSHMTLYDHLLQVTVQRGNGYHHDDDIKQVIFCYRSQNDKDLSLSSDASYMSKEVVVFEREMSIINRNLPLSMHWKDCYWKSISLGTVVRSGYNLEDIIMNLTFPVQRRPKKSVDRSSVNSIIQGIVNDIENVKN
jgi:hypothetical protein